MGRGDLTRTVILEEAGRLAGHVGLGGLTIGSLAERTRLSKSGLFAHFGSKESLQIDVLEHATQRYLREVLRPALRMPRGEPRLRELFERWLSWSAAPGGCLFIASASELDDQPGAVRDTLVRSQRDFTETITTMFRSAIAEGHLSPDADPEQLAFGLQSIVLGFHHLLRLLDDPQAEARARRAFEHLLDSARTQQAAAGHAAAGHAPAPSGPALA